MNVTPRLTGRIRVRRGPDGCEFHLAGMPLRVSGSEAARRVCVVGLVLSGSAFGLFPTYVGLFRM